METENEASARCGFGEGMSTETLTLKVAVLSSAQSGGAGIAAHRITEALNLSGEIEADFLDIAAMGETIPNDAAAPGNMSNRQITDTHFTVEFPGYIRGWLVQLLQHYDILNIHWAPYLLGLAEIDELSRRGKPILFTCHDYYYFTGGCHYPAKCQQLGKGCYACPQVDREYCATSVIAANRKIKKRILSRPNVHLAAPSAFLIKEAVSAGMVSPEKTHVLRNAYSPISGWKPKEPKETPRIVLIADSMKERRKGMALAIEALELAWRELNKKSLSTPPFVVDLVGKADEEFIRGVNAAGFAHLQHGRITEHERIASILASSDFLLTCSFEDNWPNIMVEAGCYGVVPIVGPGHGCEEFVKIFGIGKVCSNFEATAFATAVEESILARDEFDRGRYLRRVMNMHAPDRVRNEYLKVFREICKEIV